MKTDNEVIFEIGNNAMAIMKSLEKKKLSQAEVLDILTVALTLSAQRSEVNKKDFIKHTSMMWDFLEDQEDDKKQSGKYTH